MLPIKQSLRKERSGFPDRIKLESMTIHNVANPHFLHDGDEYFVAPELNGSWAVTKFSWKGSLGEYSVAYNGKNVSCTCPSGRRHTECKHKQMVAMIIQK